MTLLHKGFVLVASLLLHCCKFMSSVLAEFSGLRHYATLHRSHRKRQPTIAQHTRKTTQPKVTPRRRLKHAWVFPLGIQLLSRGHQRERESIRPFWLKIRSTRGRDHPLAKFTPALFASFAPPYCHQQHDRQQHRCLRNVLACRLRAHGPQLRKARRRRGVSRKRPCRWASAWRCCELSSFEGTAAGKP